MSTRPTFEPGGQYDQGNTARTTATRRPEGPKEDPRIVWLRDYRRGRRDAAEAIAKGSARQTFGSFAATPYAAGYRARVQEEEGSKP